MVNTPRPVTPAGILAQDLNGLLQHLEIQENVNPEFKIGLQQAALLAAGLESYVDACTTPESPALSAIIQRTQAEDWTRRFADGELVQHLEQEMLSGHTEGQLLKLLVAISGASRILEIGMFTGYSALAMAEALPDDGELIACEIDPYAVELAQQCFQESPHGHKIHVKLGPAIATLQHLADANEAFDFVFLDADKGSYIDYFKFLLDQDLVNPHGVICADNTLMQGQPYLSQHLDKSATANGRAIAHFNEIVANDPRVEQVLLPLRDGVTLIRRL